MKFNEWTVLVLIKMNKYIIGGKIYKFLPGLYDLVPASIFQRRLRTWAFLSVWSWLLFFNGFGRRGLFYLSFETAFFFSRRLNCRFLLFLNDDWMRICGFWLDEYQATTRKWSPSLLDYHRESALLSFDSTETSPLTYLFLTKDSSTFRVVS